MIEDIAKIFPLSHKNIMELLDPKLGATVIKPLELPLIIMLHEVLRYYFFFVEAEDKRQESNYHYRCIPSDTISVWTVTAQCLARALNNQFRDLEMFSEPIVFDDLYLTAYPKPEKINAPGVARHRDTNCKGLVASIILKGTLPFCTDEARFSVRTGEILLMRAKGFHGLQRPYHSVGNVWRETVFQFGLRQYIDPNIKEYKKEKE